VNRIVDKRTVDVLQLAREGGSVEGELEAVELARLAAMPAAPSGRIRFHLQGRLDPWGRSAADLKLEGRLGLTCDLCGARLEWALDEVDGFFFVDDEAQLGALPITAEGDEPLLASRAFDLRGLIEEQAILALPISPRHPACQQRAQDAESERESNRPFEVLAALKRGQSDIQ
jgi:uncharacterized protein